AGCAHQGPDGESVHHEEDCIDAPSQMRGARDGAPEGPTLPAHILAAESANASRRAPTPTSSSSLPHARGQRSLARLSWLKRFPSGRLNGEKPGGACIHRYECPDLFPISCEVCPPGPRTFALGCSFRNTGPTTSSSSTAACRRRPAEAIDLPASDRQAHRSLSAAWTLRPQASGAARQNAAGHPAHRRVPLHRVAGALLLQRCCSFGTHPLEESVRGSAPRLHSLHLGGLLPRLPPVHPSHHHRRASATHRAALLTQWCHH